MTPSGARRSANSTGPAVTLPDGQPGADYLETTDVDLIENLLSSSYADLRIDAHGHRGGLRRTRSVLTPAVQLDRDQWTLAFDVVAGAPLGVLTVSYLRAGQASYRSDGSERRYGPGDVFLALQPDHSYTATIANSDIEVAVLDPALPSQIADTGPGRPHRPVRFTGYEPVSAQAARIWKNTNAYVRDSVLASRRAAAQPLLAASAARLLAATALVTFPNTALADPTSQDHHDAHPGTLRRAVTYIDEHAHEDITAADIAAAAYVTVRAIQLAFRRHLNTTPTDYLRRVRLSHAHHDLTAAGPGSDTVTTVAYRWGFPTPSRFAALYRQTYGVTPSHTLRRD